MENENSETDADEQSTNEGLEAENVEAKYEIVLPNTVEGLRDRFNQLSIAFTREKNTEHRHELALLLDEVLDRKVLEYNKLNNVIADTQAENTSDEQMEDEDVLTIDVL